MPANPGQPQTLADVVSALIQSQDNAADTPDTALYDVAFVAENVAITDAWVLTTHSPSYPYNDAAAKFGMATFS